MCIRDRSTADTQLRTYVAEGEVLNVPSHSFGSIGVFAIPEMGRFYRHVPVSYTHLPLRLYRKITGLPSPYSSLRTPPAWTFGLWLTSSFTTKYDEETVMGFVKMCIRDSCRSDRTPLRRGAGSSSR